MTATGDLMSWWLWPLNAAKLGSDLIDTMIGARDMVTARSATIETGWRDPLNADRRELGLMVSEKVAAFASSGKAIEAAVSTMRRAADANGRALGRLAGGSVMSPVDWWRLAELNLAASTAALAAALTPVRRTVHANRLRLAVRC